MQHGSRNDGTWQQFRIVGSVRFRCFAMESSCQSFSSASRALECEMYKQLFSSNEPGRWVELGHSAVRIDGRAWPHRLARRTNENTNGRLRQYFPKGTDLSVHSDEEIAAVAAALNAPSSAIIVALLDGSHVRSCGRPYDSWLTEMARAAFIGAVSSLSRPSLRSASRSAAGLWRIE
jgi:hypothetical protein